MLEAATPLLFERGCLGTEELSPPTAIRVYFSPDVSAASLRTLARELSVVFPELSVESAPSVDDQDWLAHWKRGWQPFALGDRFLVVPTWEQAPRTDRVVLRIDPERAFGTGTHETTRLSVALLERHAVAGAPAVDAGTGTGILAMVAACLGCRPVLGLESDPEAASCACANVSRNELGDRIRIEAVRIEEAHPEPAATVVANLSLSLLTRVARTLTSWCRPDGVVILSGLLVDETPSLRPLLPECADFIEECHMGDWAAVAVRPRR